MTAYAAVQLQDILQATGLSAPDAEHAANTSTWQALTADAPLTAPAANTWIVQGSVEVLHNNLVLDTLPAGTLIPAHARGYALRASASGAVVATLHDALPTAGTRGAWVVPTRGAAARAPASQSEHAHAPQSAAESEPAPTSPEPSAFAPFTDQRHVANRPISTLRTLQSIVLQRLGNRWPFIAAAAVTLQALGLAQPIAVGFAIDEVLISEHRHAWTLCILGALAAAALRYLLQRAAHETLFIQTPEDVVTRGTAYAAWLQGSGCSLGVLFVAFIDWRMAVVMLLGLLAQGVLLVRALPVQKVWAEASATRRTERASLLKPGLRHAEALLIQGLVPTLAEEAGRWDAPAEDAQVAAGPRIATLVAWLSHVALIIVGAFLCQFDQLSLGMLVATIVLNLQAHHEACGLVAHAGELLRPALAAEDRRGKPPDVAALRASIVQGERLALTGAQARARTRHLRALLPSEPSTSVLMIHAHATLPAGTLRSCVARNSHVNTADVLRALAWCGADALLAQGIDTPLLADDPRLSQIDKTRLHLAHALCAAPTLLLLDGVLDACGVSLGQALLINMSRGLPNTAVILATQRDDLAALCHRQFRLTETSA